MQFRYALLNTNNEYGSKETQISKSVNQRRMEVLNNKADDQKKKKKRYHGLL